jgi:hypothetical protein
MRWFLLSRWAVGCLALVGSSLAAQEPAGKKASEPIPPPRTSGPVDASCPAPCASTYKACVAVPGVTVKTKVVFGCREVDYCLPRCGLFGGCRDACPTENCEYHARTKRVLLKKVVTEECTSTKCVVQERVRENCPPHQRLMSWLHGRHGGAGHNPVALPAEPAPIGPGTPLPR